MIPAFNGDPWPGDAARYTLACWCLHRSRSRARGGRGRGWSISLIEDRERLQRAMRLIEWLGACPRFAPIGVVCALLFIAGCSSNTGPLAAADAADLGGSDDVAHVLQPRDAGELELEDAGDAGDEHQVDEHQVDAGELEDPAGGAHVDAGELEDAGAHVDAGELEDAGAHVDAGSDAGAGGFDCAATSCPGGFVCLACAGCVPIGFACETP